MTSRALVALVRQNLSRSRRSFALSVFGISVGIASLTFFLITSGPSVAFRMNASIWFS